MPTINNNNKLIKKYGVVGLRKNISVMMWLTSVTNCSIYIHFFILLVVIGQEESDKNNNGYKILETTKKN